MPGNQLIALLQDNRSLQSRFTAMRTFKEGDMRWAAQKQYALQLIARNDKLQECSPESLEMAMLDVAFSGLSLSPSLHHGYLIPYGHVCTFSPGYRGLEYLAYKGNTVRSVQAVLVHKNDHFKVYTKDARRSIDHTEARDKRGPVTHAYCVAEFINGGRHIEVMDRHALDAVRQAAERKGGGKVWRSSFVEEMEKKAVIRRASKHWPLDPAGNMAHALDVMDRYDPIEFGGDQPPPVEQPQELLVSGEQIMELHAMLVENGLEDGNKATRWLKRKAEALGYYNIDGLPARLFDETKASLRKRLATYMERQAQKQ